MGAAGVLAKLSHIVHLYKYNLKMNWIPLTKQHYYSFAVQRLSKQGYRASSLATGKMHKLTTRRRKKAINHWIKTMTEEHVTLYQNKAHE